MSLALKKLQKHFAQFIYAVRFHVSFLQSTVTPLGH